MSQSAPTFLSELKRRNVIRVMAAYIVISWLILQVGETLFKALLIDSSANSLLLAILLLGFIPTSIFSWVYELTPDGLKKESDLKKNGHLAITHETAKKLDYITISSVILLLATLAWDRYIAPPVAIPSQTAENLQQEQSKKHLSIAVLPFADMSVEGDQEYFGDGIAEELLNVLAKIKGLRVAARTSSFKFKGATADITEIGKALNVSTVLEGSIRKSGDQIRITAQLINVADGYHIWSHSYDRKLENIFQVQDEITQSIVNTLKLELDITQVKTHSTDIKAYELYLRGRELLRNPNKQRLLQALDFFEQAIAVDANYAQAYAGITSVWLWLEDYGGYSASIAFPKIESNARKALTLNYNMPEALIAMGVVYHKIYSDPLAAAILFRQASQVSPNDVAVYYHYAQALEDLGDYKLAIENRYKSVELSPLSTFFMSRLASQLVNQNRLEEAYVVLDKLFAIDPEDDYGQEELANLYMYNGEFAKAIQTYKIVHESRAGDPYASARIATLYQSLGQSEKSDYWINQTRLRGENNRWEIDAKSTLAAQNNDWQLLLDISQHKASQDYAIAKSWEGTAYLNLHQNEQAIKTFEQAIKLSKADKANYNMSIYKAYLGLAILEHDQQPHYHKLAIEMFKNHIKGSNSNFGSPPFNAHYGLAMLYAKTPATDNSRNNEQVYKALNNAIETGFRDAALLQQNFIFSHLKDTAEFIDVIKTINTLNEKELELLTEMGL